MVPLIFHIKCLSVISLCIETRNATFYKNGIAVLVNKTTTDKLINKLMDNLPQKLGFNSFIGFDDNTKKQLFGEMDEFYIFNEALNETDLNELMQNCTPTIKVLIFFFL